MGGESGRPGAQGEGTGLLQIALAIANQVRDTHDKCCTRANPLSAQVKKLVAPADH